MNVVAPHLVERLPFLFPLYAGGPHRPIVVRTGVLLYSTLARARLNGRISEERALQARSAAAHRAAALLGALRRRAHERRPPHDRERRRGGRTRRGRPQLRGGDGDPARTAPTCTSTATTSRCARRSIVNATGPWLDHLRRLEDPARGAVDQARRRACTSSSTAARTGAPRSRSRRARCASASRSRGRGCSCSGRPTRCTRASPTTPRVTDEDVRTILDEAASAIDGIGAARASFLGLRVLPGRPRRDRERAPRDGVHARPDRDAQRRRRQADDVPPHRARRARAARRAEPRPRAAPAAGRDRPRERRLAGRARRADAQPSAASVRLAGRGRRAPRARRRRRCSSRSCPDVPICARRMPWARTHEFALRDEDVIRRRTTGWLAGVARF